MMGIDDINNLETENKKLKQENEKLKSQYNCYACDTCNGKEDYRNMKRHYENAIKTVHNYSSALKEIKKIANEFDYWNNNLPEASNIINKIKEKINEVLKDD